MLDGLDIKVLGRQDDIIPIASMYICNQTEDTGQVPRFAEVLECFKKWQEESYYDMWLANLGINFIGYAMGKRDGLEYFSHGVYVKPEFRRRGIATELKKAQVDFVRSLGCNQVVTEIWGDNPASFALQKKFGFASTCYSEGPVLQLSLTLNHI